MSNISCVIHPSCNEDEQKTQHKVEHPVTQTMIGTHAANKAIITETENRIMHLLRILNYEK